MRLYSLIFCFFITSIITTTTHAKTKKPKKGFGLIDVLVVVEKTVGIVEKVQDIKIKANPIKAPDTQKKPLNLDPEVISVDPKLATVITKRALQNATSGNHRVAIQGYERALKLDRNNWNIWHKYGGSLLHLKRFQEAENAYTRSIELGGNEHTWIELGKSLMHQGKKQEAKEAYEKALSLNSRNKHAANMISRMNKAITDEIYVGISKPIKHWYVVNAKPSLSLRSSPSVTTENKIGRITDGTSVLLLKYAGGEQTINGKKGRWVHIKHLDTQGYVFSAYLLKMTPT